MGYVRRRKPGHLGAVALFVVLVIVALSVGGIEPYNPLATDAIARLAGASADHWYGCAAPLPLPLVRWQSTWSPAAPYD